MKRDWVAAVGTPSCSRGCMLCSPRTPTGKQRVLCHFRLPSFRHLSRVPGPIRPLLGPRIPKLGPSRLWSYGHRVLIKGFHLDRGKLVKGGRPTGKYTAGRGSSPHTSPGHVYIPCRRGWLWWPRRRSRASR